MYIYIYIYAHIYEARVLCREGEKKKIYHAIEIIIIHYIRMHVHVYTHIYSTMLETQRPLCVIRYQISSKLGTKSVMMHAAGLNQ